VRIAERDLELVDETGLYDFSGWHFALFLSSFAC